MQAANWFVGLRLPEPSDWIEVTAGLPSGVRRFHPGDLHITVAPNREERLFQVVAHRRLDQRG